ncbi:hypothetical protein FB451DRAFT_1196251 [Mycena latifolia]|nr:hypothetical protein FB451DRAFT_1196251 [Mycena latifolia]
MFLPQDRRFGWARVVYICYGGYRFRPPTTYAPPCLPPPTPRTLLSHPSPTFDLQLSIGGAFGLAHPLLGVHRPLLHPACPALPAPPTGSSTARRPGQAQGASHLSTGGVSSSTDRLLDTPRPLFCTPARPAFPVPLPAPARRAGQGRHGAHLTSQLVVLLAPRTGFSTRPTRFLQPHPPRVPRAPYRLQHSAPGRARMGYILPSILGLLLGPHACSSTCLACFPTPAPPRVPRAPYRLQHGALARQAWGASHLSTCGASGSTHRLLDAPCPLSRPHPAPPLPRPPTGSRTAAWLFQ